MFSATLCLRLCVLRFVCVCVCARAQSQLILGQLVYRYVAEMVSRKSALEKRTAKRMQDDEQILHAFFVKVPVLALGIFVFQRPVEQRWAHPL